MEVLSVDKARHPRTSGRRTKVMAAFRREVGMIDSNLDSCKGALTV